MKSPKLLRDPPARDRGDRRHDGQLVGHPRLRVFAALRARTAGRAPAPRGRAPRPARIAAVQPRWGDQRLPRRHPGPHRAATYSFPAANTSLSVVRVRGERRMLFRLNHIAHLSEASLLGFDPSSRCDTRSGPRAPRSSRRARRPCAGRRSRRPSRPMKSHRWSGVASSTVKVTGLAGFHGAGQSRVLTALARRAPRSARRLRRGRGCARSSGPAPL